MEKVNTLMMQVLGVRPNEFEEEIIESTGEDLYIKRFVLDVVKSTCFRGVSTFRKVHSKMHWQIWQSALKM